MADPCEPADIPTDDGVALATISRAADRELRIRWRTFNGHPFIDVREWAASRHTGEWWPVKGKGLTIKPRELDEVLSALRHGAELAAKTTERATVNPAHHLPTNSR
jgi:hypothetical protein